MNMDTKKMNYETWRVHSDITSKIRFTTFKKASDIEEIVLNRLNIDDIENDLVKEYVKSFLIAVNYDEIAVHINNEIMEREINKN
jgi:hypothetical protein